jgi:SAM-dependent methyltransferase
MNWNLVCRPWGDLFSCGRVLDWGCGCGRTLRWMVERAMPHQFSGCDVDAAAIEWCQNNLRLDFEVTEAPPPLPYQDGAFELVFGVSVFTHLNEDFQQRWLAELCRIIALQGFLLLSVAGTNIANTPGGIESTISRSRFPLSPFSGVGGHSCGMVRRRLSIGRVCARQVFEALRGLIIHFSWHEWTSGFGSHEKSAITLATQLAYFGHSAFARADR